MTCTVCRQSEGVLRCDHCHEAVCSGCSDILMTGPEGEDMILLCEICYDELYEELR